MIKNVILLVIVLFATGIVNAQSWKDSLRMGKQYYQDGNFKQAYQSLLEAQKLAPSEVDLSQDIGNAAYRSQDFEMAEKAFRAAASNNTDNINQSKHWHNVGNSQMQAKNYQAAVESYKNALRKNPSDDKTRYNLAEAQRKVQQQEKQEQKQNKSDNQEQSDSDDQNTSQNSQNDNQSNNPEENQSDQNQNDQNQSADADGGDGGEVQDSEGKLSDRKTDRMLEDLLKKEMETKRKVRGIESGKNQEQIKSGKRW